MLPNFVIDEGEGWFVYTCTGCDTEIRFGPYNGEEGTEQFRQAQLKAQEDLCGEGWSSTLKCPKCLSRRAIIRRYRLSRPIPSRKQFGLTRERYTAIDDDLHRAAAYFQHLAAEIDTSAVATNKHSQIWEQVQTIRNQIEQLRRDLEKAQRRQGGA